MKQLKIMFMIRFITSQQKKYNIHKGDVLLDTLYAVLESTIFKEVK